MKSRCSRLICPFCLTAIVFSSCTRGPLSPPPRTSAGKPTVGIFSGACVGVIDGDTITVMHDAAAKKIRLNGIDCPESGQAFGEKAKQFTSALCFGQQVSVEVKETDRYGRIVADVVIPDGRVLNREIVGAGLAWWYKRYSVDETLGKLESLARAARRGLWSGAHPTAPWDFRRGATMESLSVENSVDALPTRNPSASRDRFPGVVSIAPPSIALESTIAATTSETVYITQTGKDYHRGGCGSLRKSKILLSLQAAMKRGYGPCALCKPPTMPMGQS